MPNDFIYKYWLPDDNCKRIECTTDTNSLIIIGANGSGKSKLGAWIEQQDGVNVHRVGAQRSLIFSEHTPLMSYSEAEGRLFYGTEDKTCWNSDKGARWDWGKNYTTKLIQDFDATLSALLAQYNNETQRYFEACKQAEIIGEPTPHTPPTSLDRLYEVWNAVFPQRRITVRDASFITLFQDEENDIEYSSTEMSDGERSVLYLAAQILCIPEKKTIIIDEPEIHLHPSLMGRLWQALELARQDCLFVFITHDVQFASLHARSDKIWIKTFNGHHWDWEYIPHSDLPDQLLLELLGNRKNVLFVEGDTKSYDNWLYSAIYADYYIVPCGGCSQVIRNTKAFASTAGLHDLKAYGLIDRDFRSEENLCALEHDGIYCLKVAEIENLFLVEPLLRIVANRFACNDIEKVVGNVKDYVVYERFEKQLGRQVCQATISSLKEKLSGVEICPDDIDGISSSFREAIAFLSPDEELEKQRERFTSALNSNDYDAILGLLNEKGVAKSIGHFFGISDKDYCSKVITMISGNNGEEILNAIKPYVPTLP